MKGEINIFKIVGIGVLVLVLLGVGGSLLLGGKDNDSLSNGAGVIAENDSQNMQESEDSVETESEQDEMVNSEELLLAYFHTTVKSEMPMLESMVREFTYTYDQPFTIDGIVGIASYRVMDLDRDGAEELLVLASDGEDYILSIYEVENDAVVKQAEKTIGKIGYLVSEGTDDISIVKTEQNNYVLFTGRFWGIVADGYEAEVSMWGYDGTCIFPVMDIIQTAGGSTDFEYEAHHYDENGNIAETVVIYRESYDIPPIWDEDGSLMKSQFSRYQIDVEPESVMFSSLENILTKEMVQEVLYRETRWGEADYSRESGYPYVAMHFSRITEQTTTEKDYILSNSDSAYLTVEDLRNLTKEECRIARNEIYARHGRIFLTEDLRVYFTSKSWYSGKIYPDDFTDDLLNEYELYNRDLITQYEADMGYN